jgi:general secretion pathway protein D
MKLSRSAFAPGAIVLALALAAPSAGQGSPELSTLNAQNADIRAFIQDVAKLTGRSFVIDPRVQGTVNVVSGGPMNRDQIYGLFLSTLRANGYVAIPTASGAFRIAPDTDAASQPLSASGERFQTQIIRLKSRDAAAIVGVIQPLVGKSGQVSASAQGNAIVITDFADNVRRLSALVADLDKETETIDLVHLQNADAVSLVGSLNALSGGDKSQRSAAEASFTPIESANAIMLKGPAASVTRLKEIIGSIDVGTASGGDTQIFRLRHASAAQMAKLLEPMIGVSSSEGREGEGQTAGVSRGSIAAHVDSNSIIVRAPAATRRAIEAVIQELDRRSDQVLVQAVVVEVSEGAARDLGVQFLLSGGDGRALPFFATSYTDISPNLLQLATGIAAQRDLPEDSALRARLLESTVGTLAGASGATGGIAVDLGEGGLFGAIIRAVKRDAGSNLLSTPSILTMDNREASFLVGQEVPVTTGEVLSQNNSNPFRTIERKDVGIKLTVRPQINADGAVTLYLRQEVSSVAPTLSVGELVFNKREIETNVLVGDQEVIVLGGLLDEGERVQSEKVPGLGDVPLIGGLFRSDGRETYQTNLMVFLKPTIIRSASDATAALSRQMDAIRTPRVADHLSGADAPSPMASVPGAQ